MGTQATPYDFIPAIRKQVEELRMANVRQAVRGSIQAHSITADQMAVGVLRIGTGGDGITGDVVVEDGAITADKLSVTDLAAITANLGSVTAGDITATDFHGGTITGTDITGATLTGGTISGYDISGGNVSGSNIIGVNIDASSNITGATITGGLFRTSAAAGEKLVITDTLVRAYDNTGHRGFEIDWHRSEGVAVNFRYDQAWTFKPGLFFFDDSNSGVEYAYFSANYASGYTAGFVSAIDGCAVYYNSGANSSYASGGNGTTNILANNNGDMWAHHYQTFSDESLKTAIKPLGKALDGVRKLRPVKYRMRGEKRQRVGFTAQDVQAVIPEAVNAAEAAPHLGTDAKPWEGERLGIDMGALVAANTQAIQELATRLEAVERR